MPDRPTEEIEVTRGMEIIGAKVVRSIDTRWIGEEAWARDIYRAMIRAKEAESRGEVIPEEN